MYNKYLKWLLICLLFITVALPLWRSIGMDKVFTINKDSGYQYLAYDDRAIGGYSIAKVSDNADSISLSCQYNRDYPLPYCSLVFELSYTEQGIDLSTYESIELDIRTYGARIQSARIYIRNYNPAYSVLSDPKTLKPNGMQYIPNESENPITLPLENFQVASWWFDELNIPPKYASPELNNITTISITTGNLMDQGLHVFNIHSIKFHGKWISESAMKTLIIFLWGAWALVLLIENFLHAKKYVQNLAHEKKELDNITAALQIQYQPSRRIFIHDELTSCLNRYGLRNHLHHGIKLLRERKIQLSMLMLDPDHLKSLNETYGHDQGDELLQHLAGLIKSSTRHDDCLCRWSGGTFVLLCYDTDCVRGQMLAEKLRQRIEDYDWPYNVNLTCSFGVAEMRADESVSEFLKRASHSLKHAKENGRNQIYAITSAHESSA